MRPVQPAPGGEHKAADADLLGGAATLKPPVRQKVDESGKAQTSVAAVTPGASLLPEPPPAEDENQPGFIGERNRPAT